MLPVVSFVLLPTVQNGTSCSFYRAYRDRAGFYACQPRCAWPCGQDASGHFALRVPQLGVKHVRKLALECGGLVVHADALGNLHLLL